MFLLLQANGTDEADDDNEPDGETDSQKYHGNQVGLVHHGTVLFGLILGTLDTLSRHFHPIVFVVIED